MREKLAIISVSLGLLAGCASAPDRIIPATVVAVEECPSLRGRPQPHKACTVTLIPNEAPTQQLTLPLLTYARPGETVYLRCWWQLAKWVCHPKARRTP